MKNSLNPHFLGACYGLWTFGTLVWPTIQVVVYEIYSGWRSLFFTSA